MFSVAMRGCCFPSPTLKSRWSKITGQHPEESCSPQCQPSLVSQVHSAIGKNRLGSSCSLSSALLTNRKNREGGNRGTCVQKGLPLDGLEDKKPLGGPSRHICGILFIFAKPFHSHLPIGHSDCYSVYWINGTVLGGERDQGSKITPCEISRRTGTGVHREVLPEVPWEATTTPSSICFFFFPS